MISGNKEVEIKFKVSNVEALRKNLEPLGAKNCGRAFERTVRFDSPAGGLEKSNKFVRVRTGFKNVITFKQKLAEDIKFKVREEIEFQIENPNKMQEVLEGLGFTKKLIMEKYREKWEMARTEVVLDELPFGIYLEIEGNEPGIKAVAGKLGLDFPQGIVEGYQELWKRFGGKGNIVFGKPLKQP